jgi:hypothetical protein
VLANGEMRGEGRRQGFNVQQRHRSMKPGKGRASVQTCRQPYDESLL